MAPRRDNPAPLTVAASLVAVQGALLLAFAAIEVFSVSSERIALGVSTAGFFLLYGAALLVCAAALTRRQGWTRGPVLITQLIQLGLAWNVRDYALVAVLLATAAALVLAGLLHPASVEALSDDPA